MPISKREFLKISGLTAGIAGLSAAGLTACSSSPDPDGNDGDGTGLESLTGDVQPIGVDERLSRIAKAQMLMVDAGIDAIVLEPGSAMLYFSGVSWRRSERLTACTNMLMIFHSLGSLSQGQNNRRKITV